MKPLALIAALTACCFGCQQAASPTAPDTRKKVEVHTPNVDVNVNKDNNGDVNVDVQRKKPSPP